MTKKSICLVLFFMMLLNITGCNLGTATDTGTESQEMLLYTNPNNPIVMSEENKEFILTLTAEGNWLQSILKVSCPIVIEYGNLVLGAYISPEITVINDKMNHRSLRLEGEQLIAFRKILRDEFGCGHPMLTNFIGKGYTYDEVVWLLGDPVWLDDAKTIAKFEFASCLPCIITFSIEPNSNDLVVESMRTEKHKN